MPELPEVEAVVRTLRPLVQSQCIRSVHVFHPIAVKPQEPSWLVDFATNRSIRRVDRKGKYVVLLLDRGLLTLHFRLDGQLVWFSSGAELLGRANTKARGVHVDVALEFGKGVLGFADRRHFGRVYAWDSWEQSPLSSLGIDALSNDFSVVRFRQLLAASARPLKDFLLDQTRVAGLGNIYSCESLWHARLDPRRRAKSLKPGEARRLHKAIVSVLARALKCCLHPAPDLHDSQWWFQGLQKILRAYGREGESCRRCGAAIQRIEQSGRSTYCCRKCQK